MTEIHPSRAALTGSAIPAPENTPSGQAVTRHTVVIPSSINMVALLGAGDEHLTLIENALDAEVHIRGNRITLRGAPDEVALAEKLLDELVAIIRTGQPVASETVERVIGMLRSESSERPVDVLSLNILSNRGRTIRPKTLNQKRYVDSIDKHTITFGIGPAGTGKTYLAMAKAVQSLQAKQVNRIILTRPAVEAGERLGFLPGTLSEKIDPYLRPLYDALHDMLDPESVPKLLAAGTIEVAPLAYMRGRAQPYEAPVLTPEGFRPIGTLAVGDLVVGSDGLPTPVLGVYPQGLRDVYRVSAQDGASTICCGEHLWTVRTPEDKRENKSRTLETREMVGNLHRDLTANYELPLVDPVEFVPQQVPLDPYALGLLLGEWCTTTSSTLSATAAESLSTADPDGGQGNLRTGSPVTLTMRDLGLADTSSSTTFVPTVYLLNSAWIRLQLLQGLLDTDGGRVTNVSGTAQVQYTTTSDRLRDDVIFLVRSLGGVVTVHSRALRGPAEHVLGIWLPEGLPPFRLARKLADHDKAACGPPLRFIDTIEPIGEQETICIQVAAEDSLYVTDDFLLTHNTLNDAFIILDEAQNTTPEQMKMFLTRLGFGSKIVVTGDVTQVDLPSGTKSGLRIVESILEGVDDLAFNRLTAHDVVRHRLVGKIVAAYEEFDAREEQSGSEQRR